MPRRERKDRWIRRYKVGSRIYSRYLDRYTEEKYYTIAVDAKDRWGCSCPKWKFKKGEKCDCHHIGATKKSLQIVENANTGELIMDQSVAMVWDGPSLTEIGERLVDVPKEEWMLMLTGPTDDIRNWAAVCYEIPPLQKSLHDRRVLRFYKHPGAIHRTTGEHLELSVADRVQGQELGVTRWLPERAL